ncbi:hypothetical protein IAE40_06480 [Pseudomonas sp. S44]|uniref:hypothetical protein n=1 Tax=Pseudomonas sp. S44 TaxID=2767450 RepID=UPI00190B6CF5|nr:hypothetical protein [Pseudomonas sp. S44]MBK0058272.1 hypothetical protein [Pseudomonas sp. S44]
MKYEKTLKKLCRLPKLDPSIIVDSFARNEGVPVSVVAISIEKPAFEIYCGNNIFLLLERPVSFHNKRSGRLTNTQMVLLEYASPVPLYLGQGQLSSTLYEAHRSPKPHQAVDQWLEDIVEIELLITYFLRYFSNSEALKDYRLIIFEAIEAFYMGLDHIAIMSLLPVFEGGLRNVQSLVLNVDRANVSSDIFAKRLKQILKEWGSRRVAKYSWHPGVYGCDDVEVDFYTHICPQADVINCFLIFFKNVLYKDSCSGQLGFNRHVILHLLDNDFNRPANFYRIFLALTHIAFIESLSNQNVPFFWPGYDTESRRLSKYIEYLGASMDGRRNILRGFGISGYPTRKDEN